MSGLAERVRALADEWFDEDDGIAHVAACQDYGCKDCVVIACATDLRALLAEDETPASSDDTEALAAELGCEYHSDGYGVCASCHEQAEQVMDSEWLTNYLAEAWDQGGA